MRRRIIALLLAIILAAGLAGCVQGAETAQQAETTPEPQTQYQSFYVEAASVNIHHRDSIEEEIDLMFYGIPDGFELTADAISLSDGFENMQVDGLQKHSDDEYTLLISGETNETWEAGTVNIETGMGDTVLTAQVYFIEEPYLWEIGAVYAHNNSPQVVAIGVQYGAFSEAVGKDDIVLSGGFEGAEILDVQYVDDGHIALTLHNSLDLTQETGMVTIKDSGFADEHGYDEDLSVGIAIVSADVSVYPQMLVYEEGAAQTYEFEMMFPDGSYQDKVTQDSIVLSGVLSGLELTAFAFEDENTMVIAAQGSFGGIGEGIISTGDCDVQIDVVEDRYVFGTATVDAPLTGMSVRFEDVGGGEIDCFDDIMLDEDGGITAHISSHAQIPADFRMIVDGETLAGDEMQNVQLMADHSHFCPMGDGLNVNLLTTLVCMVMDGESLSYDDAEAKVIEFLQIDNPFFDIRDNTMLASDFDAQVFLEKAAGQSINDYLAVLAGRIADGDMQSFMTQVSADDTADDSAGAPAAQPLMVSSLSLSVGTLHTGPSSDLGLTRTSASSYAMSLLQPAIKKGLTSLGGAIGEKAGDMAFNWVLQSVGIDTTTDEQKILNQLKVVEGMLSDIKNEISDMESQMSKEIEMSTFQTRSSTLTDDFSKINNAYETYQRICNTSDEGLRESLKAQLLDDIEKYNMPLILEHINEELTSDSAGKVPLLQNYWTYLKDAHVFQHQSTPAMTDVYNDYVGIQSKALMLYTEYCHAKADDITNPNDLFMSNAQNEHDKFTANIEAQAKYIKSNKGSSYVKYYNANYDNAFNFLIVNANGSKWSLAKTATNYKFGYAYYGYIPDDAEDNDFFMGLPAIVSKDSQRNASSTHSTLAQFFAGVSGNPKIGDFLDDNGIYPAKASNSTIWLFVGWDNYKSKGRTYGLKTSRKCSDMYVDYISAHDGHTHSLAELYHH